MITGNVLLSPMNTYFKLSGKGFNFNLDACKINGKSFLCEVLNQQRHYHGEWFAKLGKPLLILAHFGEHICASPSLLSR
jgi:hypothetical protein